MQSYNTQLSAIKLPEYGRNLQQLVEYCKTIPDREKRTRYAYGIVEIMSDLCPESAAVENTKQMLWDHLAIISNYELDIDYPYPILSQEKFIDRPEPLRNPQQPNIHWRIYGKVVEDMIKKATEMEDAAQRTRMFELCANHMKLHFHKTHPNADEDNDKIIRDLLEYTRGQFQEEISKIYLCTKKELQENIQYDPASLMESKKKKKKRKK